jgi:3-phosphoshikimate 1-carboxyvinyltransferase
LYVSNSGTTIRFLTALVALGNGDYHLEGVARMHERPIGDLANALRQLGADVQCESPDRCPPVRVRAAGLRGGRVTVRGDISSQFLSGLLMAAPYAADAVEILVDGPLVSQPYVRMTTEVMRAFGVDVERRTPSEFYIGGQKYAARDYSVEPDASAASYFWAAAAITGGRVAVEGLSKDSLQGDVAFCECLADMGCRVQYQDDEITVLGGPLQGVEVDMNAISDTAQTLAVVALFANGPTTIHGVGHIRHKESDRIGDMARELRKLGAEVDELPDGLRIVPGPPRSAELETYNDHRMAMSLALAGLRTNGVVILNPQCTSKTYPGFFSDLAAVAKAS